MVDLKVMTADEKAALNEDARNRALRTFLQSISIDLLLAVALLLFNVFSQANGWSDMDWAAIGFLLVKTVLVSAASFVMRYFMDPSKFPTPLPPAPQPEPAVPAEDPAHEQGGDPAPPL